MDKMNYEGSHPFKKGNFLHLWGLVLLAAFVFCYPVPARSAECKFDRKNPNITNARINFKTLNYECAEEELGLLLRDTTLSYQDKANAHVLLAAVYYARLKNDSDMKTRVIDQFKEAFRTYRNWRGELDIKSTDFEDLMNEARQQLDQEPAIPVTETPETKPAEKPPVIKESKPAGPSATVPLITTGITAASAVFYILSAGKASDKWDDYVNGGATSTLYDSYKSANNTKKIAAGVTIGSAVVSGYFWFKYFRDKGKNQEAPSADIYNNGLNLAANSKGLVLIYRFK
ncbi:MAG: hypothetical protein NT002_02575 [candidate division Zixibacteria bacterium]|nr:hypothetical protein [candidate division Zixibacteria bacterium]